MSRVNHAVVLPWVRTVVRVGLGIVWIVAGAVKVVDPGQSVIAVEAYEVLPRGVAQIVGWGLPFVEVLLGLALVAGVFTRWSAVISGLMQLAFIIGLIQAWARGLTIDCGCFSSGGQVAADETTYGLDLVRDICFLLAALWLVAQPLTRLSVDGLLGTYDGYDEEKA
jgi:uncharacterized membrane protein YphA (DoxX/SURF4 family)